jgi:hypothetical protein
MDSRSAIRINATTGASSRGSVRILRQGLIAAAFAAATIGHAEVHVAQIDFRIASSGSGPAQSMQPSRTPAHTDLLEWRQRGARQALRVREDAERHRLWVLTLEHVYVYDTRTRKLLRRVNLPNWPIAGHMCPPDIALGKDGAAFVSSNVQPSLLQVGPADFHAREHRLQAVSGKQWEIGFGALAFAADGTLYGLSALAGSLFTINLASGTATEIGSSEPPYGACELTSPERILVRRLPPSR